MKFLTYLQESAIEIEREIAKVTLSWEQETKKSDPQLLPLFKALSEQCKGGKRIRGTLVRLGYELAVNEHAEDKSDGKDSWKKSFVFAASCAIEVFQASVLGHDDIVDKSPVRRGKPSLYASLGGDHYGVSQAICLSDYGLYQSIKLISESELSDKSKNHAVGFFTQMALDTIRGQIMDIALTGDKSITQKQVETIGRQKTAMYTITGPMSVGAILGQASEELLESIQLFGQDLGLSYQIQDDILDIFGADSIIGKKRGGDIREGKATLLMYYAFANASASDKKLLISLFANPKITDKEIKTVQDIFVACGALAFAKAQEKKYLQKAKKHINRVTKNKSLAGLLEDGILFLTERGK